MPHLLLTRKEGEGLHLSIAPGASAELLLDHLRKDGITISVAEIKKSQVRLSIEAPMDVLVLRDELVDGDF